MKRITLFLALLVITTVGCRHEIDRPTMKKSVDIFTLIQNELGDKNPFTREQIYTALMTKSNVPTCRWDKNRDGVVNTADLSILLAGYGTEFTTSDLLEMLSVFGEEYILNLITQWNNFAHIKCNGGLDNTTRVECEGSTYTYTSHVSIRWYDVNGDLIQDQGDQLEFQTYSHEPPYLPRKDCPGITPLQNGINTFQLEITSHQGYTYRRSGVSWVASTSWINVIGEVEGNSSEIDNLWQGPFEYLEFCVNCEQ